MRRLTGRSVGHSCLCYLPAFVFLAAIDVQQVQAQEHEEALKRRFLQETPLQWEEYAKRIEMVQGKYVLHTTWSVSNSTLQEQYEYKRNEQGKSLQLIYEKEGNKEYEESYYGVNSRYAFQLRRKSSNSPWTVIELANLSKESIPEGFKFFFDMHRHHTTQLVMLDQDLLAEAVRQPTFRVDRCKAVQRDGEDLVEVVFSYPHEPNPSPPFNRAQAGTLLLDPKRFWVKRFSDLKTTGGTMKTSVRGIGETSNFLPIPKVIDDELEHTFTAEEIAKGSPPKATVKTHAEYDLYIPRSLPDEKEFTLLAFGLSEPKGLEMPENPSHWWLWFIALGLLSLAVGAYFLKRVQRRKLASGKDPSTSQVGSGA